jgi:two-component system LytT family response regulator
MNSIRALIVDDEPLARRRLRDLLVRDPEVVVAGECADGFEAVEAVRLAPPDVLFLDVQMPEKDGFDVVREVGVDAVPAVVFVTAFDQYAVRAFQVHALDYLLKPFDDSRFADALCRAKVRARGARDEDMARRVLALLDGQRRRPGYLERIAVKAGETITFLPAADVDWVKAEGNYVRLHARGASYLLRETVANMEAQLDPSRFLRIHRSTIVNIDRVAAIQQLFHGAYRVRLADGSQHPLSRGYRDRLPRVAEKCP